MEINKKAIIWGIAGLVIGMGAMYFYAKSKGATGSIFLNANGKDGKPAKTLKKGDKGKDILAFQHNLNALYGYVAPETGMYDRQTAGVVSKVFAGTNALKDAKTGAIDKYFVEDFNKVVGSK